MVLTLSEKEYFLFFSLIIGFAFFCHLLTLFSSGGISENEETYIYFLFLGVCPLLTYLAYHTVNTKIPQVKSLLLFTNGYLTLFLIIFLLVSLIYWKKVNHNLFYLYSFLQIILTYGIVVFVKFTHPQNDIFSTANQWLVKIFPFALLILLLSPYQLPIINASLQSLPFQLGLGLGAILSILIFAFYQLSKNNNYTNTLKTVSKVIFFLILIVQPLFFLETYNVNNSRLIQEDIFWLSSVSFWFEAHYLPTMGPAYLTLNGGIPLVDSFSQYGFFNYILYTLAFKYLITPSLFAVVILAIILNIIENIAYFLILNKTISNKFLVYFGCMAILVIRLVAYSSGQVQVPSENALRYLPPILLLLSIVYLPRLQTFNIFTIISGLLCSLWSLESLVYGCAMYLAYSIGMSLVQSLSIKNTLKNILFILVIFLAGHVIYSCFIFGMYDTLPRYDIYLEMITAHIDSSKNIVSWNHPINPTFLIWGFYAVAYFITFVYFWKLFNIQKERQLAFVRYILPVAVFGAIAFFYYVRRSFDKDMLILLLPVSIVFLTAANQLLFKNHRQTFYSLPSFAIILSLGFMLITAYSVKNFTLQNDIIRNMAPISSCITTGKECQNVYNDFKNVIRKTIYGPPLSNELLPQDMEAYRMILKWQPFEKEIIFFWTYVKTEQILMLAKKFHKFKISSVLNDSLSPSLVKKIVNGMLVEKGNIIIKHKSNDVKPFILDYPNITRNSPSKLGSIIFQAIKQKWKLRLVDQTKTVEVYQVIRKKDNVPN